MALHDLGPAQGGDAVGVQLRQQRRRQVTLEQKLYWPGPFWALFVAVLTAEWVLRKRSQLR